MSTPESLLVEETEHHIEKAMSWEISFLDMITTRFQAFKFHLRPICRAHDRKIVKRLHSDLEFDRQICEYPLYTN